METQGNLSPWFIRLVPINVHKKRKSELSRLFAYFHEADGAKLPAQFEQTTADIFCTIKTIRVMTVSQQKP